jgi:hypothetical protein
MENQAVSKISKLPPPQRPAHIKEAADLIFDKLSGIGYEKNQILSVTSQLIGLVTNKFTEKSE